MTSAIDRYKVLAAGVFSIMLTLGVARFAYTPLMPLMQQQAGLGVGEAGWLAGAPGLDDVPISEAVRASSALPGLYRPARIGDRDYVDGALRKTLHASVALKEGAKS